MVVVDDHKLWTLRPKIPHPFLNAGECNAQMERKKLKPQKCSPSLFTIFQPWSQRQSTLCPELNITLSRSSESFGRVVVWCTVSKAAAAISSLRNYCACTLSGIEATAPRCTVGVAETLTSNKL